MNVSIKGNFNTGEFEFYSDDRKVMYLDVKLNALNQNHQDFDSKLSYELQEALSDAYNKGRLDLKRDINNLMNKVE